MFSKSYSNKRNKHFFPLEFNSIFMHTTVRVAFKIFIFIRLSYLRYRLRSTCLFRYFCFYLKYCLTTNFIKNFYSTLNSFQTYMYIMYTHMT